MKDEEVMTPEEFKAAMKEIRDNSGQGSDYDKELCHIFMDNLMCKMLRQLGYTEGVYVFEQTNKWYS